MRYGVCRGIFKQEGYKGKDGVNEKGEDDGVDEEEDDEAAAHCDFHKV